MALRSIDSTTIDRAFAVSVLIVDDETESRYIGKKCCETQFENIVRADLSLMEACSVEEALALLSQHTFHVVLLDRDLGKDSNGQPIDGINFIREIHAIQPYCEIIMLTANESPIEIVRAMSEGASDYLMKKNTPEYMAYREQKILYALRRAQTNIEKVRSARQTNASNDFYICNSPAMKHLDRTLEALAEINLPVLITGDTGLGKTATAKRLHSYRSKYLQQEKRPFFNINIGALVDNLAQSELFGHEAGAFTGASKLKVGYFELANGGTLFLDEIGDSSPEMQLRLLKVVEEREFQRVGGQTTIKTSARVIFATNKNLKKLVEEGKFREDLYSRISTFILEMPALEDRKEDLPEIIRMLVEKANAGSNSRKMLFDSFPASLIEHLSRPDVPGNIRGIENDIQRLLIYSTRETNGFIDVSGWQRILSFEKSPRSSGYRKSSDSPISLQELLSRDTDLIADDFPGIKEFLELMERKILVEADKKKLTNSALSKYFAVHPTGVSRRRNALLRSSSGGILK